MQARKLEVQQQIQQELAVASAQQLVTKITENVSIRGGVWDGRWTWYRHRVRCGSHKKTTAAGAFVRRNVHYLQLPGSFRSPVSPLPGGARSLSCAHLARSFRRSRQCFAKCVTRPSTSLSGGEERCLTQCMQLYMAAFDKISRSYVTRISKQARS